MGIAAIQLKRSNPVSHSDLANPTSVRLNPDSSPEPRSHYLLVTGEQTPRRSRLLPRGIALFLAFPSEFPGME